MAVVRDASPAEDQARVEATVRGRDPALRRVDWHSGQTGASSWLGVTRGFYCTIVAIAVVIIVILVVVVMCSIIKIIYDVTTDIYDDV